MAILRNTPIKSMFVCVCVCVRFFASVNVHLSSCMTCMHSVVGCEHEYIFEKKKLLQCFKQDWDFGHKIPFQTFQIWFFDFRFLCFAKVTWLFYGSPCKVDLKSWDLLSYSWLWSNLRAWMYYFPLFFIKLLTQSHNYSSCGGGRVGGHVGLKKPSVLSSSIQVCLKLMPVVVAWSSWPLMFFKCHNICKNVSVNDRLILLN